MPDKTTGLPDIYVRMTSIQRHSLPIKQKAESLISKPLLQGPWHLNTYNTLKHSRMKVVKPFLFKNNISEYYKCYYVFM